MKESGISRLSQVRNFFPQGRLLLFLTFALVVPILGVFLTNAPLVWPISVLLYNAGLIFILSRVNRSISSIILFVSIASILFLDELCFFFSYYLQNSGFNNAFFYHLRKDVIYAGISEHFVLFSLMLIALFAYLWTSSSYLFRQKERSRLSVSIGIGVFAFGLMLSPPAKTLAHHCISLMNPALGDNQNNPFAFFPELKNPNVRINSSGKEKPNIILIYAESLEARYFDEDVFPRLLPNLTAIRNRSIDFTNVSQGIGAEWTVAGIVSSQCGYPLVAGQNIDGSQVGMLDEFLPKAVCLGDLLENEGYRLVFMGGADARFAGKYDFLRTHGFEKIYDRRDLAPMLEDSSYLNPWGLYDDSMFDLAYDKFIELNNRHQPFLLNLLTLDTHHPSGYPSKSCGNYGTGDNSSLNAVQCADKNISTFINRVRSGQFSNNTIIIVLSDHLAYKNTATHLLETSKGKPRLFFIVNRHDGESIKNDRPGLHYDIAPTILDVLGYTIEGQMGFGSPLTKGPGYLNDKFGGNWEDYSDTIVSISRGLWENNYHLDKNGIKFSASDLSLFMAGKRFKIRESDGYSDQPALVYFVFDKSSLSLEKSRIYLSDEKVPQDEIIADLIDNKDKIVLSIATAKYLPGFTDINIHPNQWVYFFGKPEGHLFFTDVITGDFAIPFEFIKQIANGKRNDELFNQRIEILQEVRQFHAAKRNGVADLQNSSDIVF